MSIKVFIDGSAGTTGLRIYERFKDRSDVTVLSIDPVLRKDPDERKKMMEESDVTFLCLPDDAAIESAKLAEGTGCILIDASTAHRTKSGWAYGFPELSDEFMENIRTNDRIAVPGCYASGFISLVFPLIKAGIMQNDYPVSCFALSGYSGAGKKAIEIYEGGNRPKEYASGRMYALTQSHKHLKEMKAVTGLARAPLFTPIVDDYYSGMTVTVPVYADMLSGKNTVSELSGVYRDHYKNSRFVQVAEETDPDVSSGFFPGNTFSGWDGMKIYVTGNEERILLTSRFDNLGKGASGAAIQCMNIRMGLEEAVGLNI